MSSPRLLNIVPLQTNNINNSASTGVSDGLFTPK